MKRELQNSLASGLMLAVPISGVFAPQQAIEQPIPQPITQDFSSQREIPMTSLESEVAVRSLNEFALNIQKDFGIKESSLMKEISGQDTKAYAWTLVNVIEAYHTASLVPGVSEDIGKLYKQKLDSSEEYWYEGIFGPGYAGSPDMIIAPTIGSDDTDWLAIQQMRVGNIEKAKEGMETTMSQWDFADGGGVFWLKQTPINTNKERGTISAATASILASGLYQATGDPKYLEFAERSIDWVLANMTNPDQLERDHDEVGTILPPTTTHQKDVWTYNQGVTITALSLLNEVDQQKYPISMAVDLLNRSLDYFEKTGYEKQPAYFNSRFFKDALGLVSKFPQLQDRVIKNLGMAIKAGPKYSSALIEHAAMLQMEAILLMDPSDYYKLVDRPPDSERNRYRVEANGKTYLFNREGTAITIYDSSLGG